MMDRRRALMAGEEKTPILPDGYRKVPYIQIAGASNQTGLYFPQTKVTFKTKYTLDASITSESYLIADRASTGLRLAIGTSALNADNGQRATGIAGGIYARPSFTPRQPESVVEGVMVIGAPNTSSYMQFDGKIDGVTYSKYTEGTTRRYGIIALRLFDANGSTRFYGKLYKLEVYSNDNLYFNFVPCVRDSDNTPGVYEVVTGTFYGDKSHITGGS